jgi:hypothetical protein
MAIAYSYPIAVPTLADTLVGIRYEEEIGNSVKNFNLQDISNLINNSVNTSAWTGVFDTSDVLEITVVNGLITNVVTIG